jgi:tripartite-type tricarboxylate transporter receptor subunit TctC
MRNLLKLFAVIGIAAAATAGAQDYPDRSIRIIVPWPPGGGTDVVGRLVTPKMTEAWGQQVVIDNRAGATGIIGTDLVAKAAPDGYTLVLGTNSTHSIAPSLFKLPFDPVKDLAPVTRVSAVPHIVTVHPSLPVKSVKELIELAKARPVQLAFGSSGNGSTPHLGGELFKTMTGVNLLHVPYKGSGQSLQDTIGGHVMVSFDTLSSVANYVTTGRLRPLGVASMKRVASFPNVPTVDESGVTGYEVTTWYGLFAPPGTPVEIVRKLHAEIARIVRLPDVKERLEGLGCNETTSASPEEFAIMVKTEIVKYAKVAKAAGL